MPISKARLVAERMGITVNNKIIAKMYLCISITFLFAKVQIFSEHLAIFSELPTLFSELLSFIMIIRSDCTHFWFILHIRDCATIIAATIMSYLQMTSFTNNKSQRHN